MMKKTTLTYMMAALLAAVMCGVPDSVQALTQEPAQQPQNSGQQQQQSNQGVTVDPSKAPLTPAPEPQTNQQQNQTLPAHPQPQNQTPTTEQQPLGAAAAGGVPTAGGGASRPAGTAIAPAKQRSSRSLLIKVGAALAAGVAIGTIYALSRGTSSTPPNTGTATTGVQR